MTDDVVDITELTKRFCAALDAHEADAQRDLWAADGVLDLDPIGRGIHRGIDSIVMFYDAVRATGDDRIHLVMGHDGVVAGNDALGTCRFRADGHRADGTPLHLAGHYEDRYRREDNRWVFTYRRVDFE